MTYAKEENGQVRNMGNVPVQYKNHLTFRKTTIEVKNSEGFYEVVEPIITEYQRLINLEPSDLSNDLYTHRVYDFTQQEIDDYDEQQEENESDAQMREHIEKGIRLHTRSYKKIWKRVNKDSDLNNKLTKSKGRKLFRWLRPTWADLKNGDFRESSKSIAAVLLDNATELQTEPAMLNTLEWLQVLIDDYKNNKYDL